MSIAITLATIYIFGIFVTFYFLVRFDALKGPYDDNFARYCSSFFWLFSVPILALVGLFKVIEGAGEARRKNIMRKRNKS
jgi:hypothetical protein